LNGTSVVDEEHERNWKEKIAACFKELYQYLPAETLEKQAVSG
jgi:hypothetical protein